MLDFKATLNTIAIPSSSENNQDVSVVIKQIEDDRGGWHTSFERALFVFLACSHSDHYLYDNHQ